jgi:hypothetical protein
MTAPEGFLRYLWPLKTPCPACGWRAYKTSGQRGRRRHRTCVACGHHWVVVARWVEVDQGGGHSEIKAL